MKSIISIALTAVALLSVLTGCGRNNENTATSNTPVATTMPARNTPSAPANGAEAGESTNRVENGANDAANGAENGANGAMAGVENGVNDVDDFISGYIRTDKGTISFNGAWAQNIPNIEMLVDFMGDKAGARLDYGQKFVYTDGATLESSTPDYELANMYEDESRGFIDSINNGTPNRSDIDRVLETAKLLEALYKSAELKKEITF